MTPEDAARGAPAEKATIYVELLGEGVEVWRPVTALVERNGIFRLPDEQPDGERWAFPQGSRVVCARRSIGDEDCLVVRALANEVGRQAGEVRVTITASSRAADVTTTDLRLDGGDWPYDPIAPATLWTDDDEAVVELHKLLRLDGDAATFESYDLSGDPPQSGGPFRMFSWWDKNQYRAARYDDCEWRMSTFDKAGDHTHCILTFDTIERGDPGYEAVPGGGWITIDSYEKYIRDDVLRLRRTAEH
jgi:hypothetical protein